MDVTLRVMCASMGWIAMATRDKEITIPVLCERYVYTYFPSVEELFSLNAHAASQSAWCDTRGYINIYGNSCPPNSSCGRSPYLLLTLLILLAHPQ